jgi:antitoxin component YwqK of YwqJK toxin-antitoxin module
MKIQQALNIINFIGAKVPKYALEREGDDYKLPSGQLITPYGYKSGLYQENKKDYVDLSSRNFSGIAYTYRNGYLAGKLTFVNGYRTGPFEYYYDDGKIKERGNERTDAKDGPYEMFYSDGSLEIKGQYDYHTKVGKWISYFKGGEKVNEIINYDDNGKKISEVGYYNNGNLRQSINYNNGERDGEDLHYWRNGNLNIRREYDNGFLLKTTVYYETGELASVSTNTRGGDYQMIQYDTEGNVIDDYSTNN